MLDVIWWDDTFWTLDQLIVAFQSPLICQLASGCEFEVYQNYFLEYTLLKNLYPELIDSSDILIKRIVQLLTNSAKTSILVKERKWVKRVYRLYTKLFF